MSGFIAGMLGALAGSWLFTRLFVLFFRSWKDGGYRRIAATYFLSVVAALIIIVLLNGERSESMADTWIVSIAFWAICDAVGEWRQRRAPPGSPVITNDYIETYPDDPPPPKPASPIVWARPGER